MRNEKQCPKPPDVYDLGFWNAEYTSTHSALGAVLALMCSINPCFTYLLTYLHKVNLYWSETIYFGHGLGLKAKNYAHSLGVVVWWLYSSRVDACFPRREIFLVMQQNNSMEFVDMQILSIHWMFLVMHLNLSLSFLLLRCIKLNIVVMPRHRGGDVKHV